MSEAAPSGRLIYALVARERTVLAEYTAYTGNFASVAAQCLEKCPTQDAKLTYRCDGHTFNFLIEDGLSCVRDAIREEDAKEDRDLVRREESKDRGSKHESHRQSRHMDQSTSLNDLGIRPPFLVVAEAAVGRQVPFLLLERIKDDFKATYGFRARTAVALAFDRQYAPKLKQFMSEAMIDSADPDKVRSVQNQVTAVKSVMIENIERVLDRGEKIELLVDKTESLRFQADTFQKSGRQLRRAMCRQNMKMKLIIVAILILIGLVLFFVICYGGGRNCTSSGSSPSPPPPPPPPPSPAPV